MKKSEMTVSMPMTTYEEFLEFKKEYENLTAELRGCFNFDYFEQENRIDFKVNSAFDLCKRFLPNIKKNANFIKTE